MLDVQTDQHGRHDILECRVCRCTELSQRLTEAESAAIYPDDYYSYATVKPQSLLKKLMGLTYKRYRYLPQFTSLLEIGCGQGAFLREIRTLGKVTGLERSEVAQRVARDLGVEVVVGDVTDDSLFKSGAFDCVYMNHSLEHLDDPERALKSIRTWLKPGGELYIALPNHAGVVARLFGRHWYHLAAPVHVTTGSPLGTSALLLRSGFTIERVDFNSDPFSIPMSAYIAAGGRPGDMPRYLLFLAGALSALLYPLSVLLDRAGIGDCVEFFARKRAEAAPL